MMARRCVLGFASMLTAMLFMVGPTLAHGGHDHADEGGIDLVMTLQVVGVMGALWLGYLVVSRQARRREGGSRDPMG